LLWAAGHHRATLYQMELGYPAAVCLGLALAAPKERVVAVEGDGSLLAGLSALTTITRYAPANLIVLVLDNGAYGTVGTGTVTSATRHGTDLVAVARGCGWDARTTARVETVEQTRLALAAAFVQPGPWLLVARAEGRLDDARGVGQIPFDIVEAAIGFRRDMIERGYA
jgi:thiamine pyrophosphate-dependent acetolactate synthase large subunit-like protein